MQHLGYVMSSFIVAGTPDDQGLNKAPAGCVVLNDALNREGKKLGTQGDLDEGGVLALR